VRCDRLLAGELVHLPGKPAGVRPDFSGRRSRIWGFRDLNYGSERPRSLGHV